MGASSFPVLFLAVALSTGRVNAYGDCTQSGGLCTCDGCAGPYCGSDCVRNNWFTGACTQYSTVSYCPGSNAQRADCCGCTAHAQCGGSTYCDDRGACWPCTSQVATCADAPDNTCLGNQQNGWPAETCAYARDYCLSNGYGAEARRCCPSTCKSCPPGSGTETQTCVSYGDAIDDSCATCEPPTPPPTTQPPSAPPTTPPPVADPTVSPPTAAPTSPPTSPPTTVPTPTPTLAPSPDPNAGICAVPGHYAGDFSPGGSSRFAGQTCNMVVSDLRARAGGFDLATIGCDAALGVFLGEDNAWVIQADVVAAGCCGGGAGRCGSAPTVAPTAFALHPNAEICANPSRYTGDAALPQVLFGGQACDQFINTIRDSRGIDLATLDCESAQQVEVQGTWTAARLQTRLVESCCGNNASRCSLQGVVETLAPSQALDGAGSLTTPSPSAGNHGATTPPDLTPDPTLATSAGAAGPSNAATTPLDLTPDPTSAPSAAAVDPSNADSDASSGGEEESKMGMGFGILIAIIVVAVAVLVVAMFFWRRRLRSKELPGSISATSPGVGAVAFHSNAAYDSGSTTYGDFVDMGAPVPENGAGRYAIPLEGAVPGSKPAYYSKANDGMPAAPVYHVADGPETIANPGYAPAGYTAAAAAPTSSATYGVPAMPTTYGTPAPLTGSDDTITYASAPAFVQRQNSGPTHLRLNESVYAFAPQAAAGTVVYETAGVSSRATPAAAPGREVYGKVLGKVQRETLAAWLESPTVSKQAAELALGEAGAGAGSFCLRQGSSGLLVLCVMLKPNVIAHFRMRESDNGFELLDSSPVAGQHFPTIPVLVAQLRDVALSDKLKVGLQDCIPYASEA